MRKESQMKLIETQISQAETNIRYYINTWREYYAKNVDIKNAADEDLKAFANLNAILKLVESSASYLRKRECGKPAFKPMSDYFNIG